MAFRVLLIRLEVIGRWEKDWVDVFEILL
jgi:hypothetical protein